MCSQTCSGQPVNAMGVAGFGVSLFGLLFTLGILCPLGVLLSFLGLFSKNRGFAIAGLIIGGLGSAIVAIGVASVAMAASAIHHYQVEVPKQAQTAEVLAIAAVEVEQFRHQHGKLPEGIEGNKLVLKFQDAYGTSLRYEPEEGTKFAVRSAGPDQEFDTPDDLRETNYETQPMQPNKRGHCQKGW